MARRTRYSFRRGECGMVDRLARIEARLNAPISDEDKWFGGIVLDRADMRALLNIAKVAVDVLAALDNPVLAGGAVWPTSPLHAALRAALDALETETE